ncbi:MAG: extracellular solute-binding protein [Gammaproteobacteria bacterium]|nr:extracellular solute-binding protein [Gammaproteobacteria bacterium]
MHRISLVALIAIISFPTFAFAGDELIIYSGRSDNFIKPIVKIFEDRTDIKVTLHAAESTALLNKLKLEGDRTDADLFISNDAGNLQKGAELSLFQAIPTNLASQIPAKDRSSENLWLGLSARARVLVVNTNSPTANKVKSVFDLALPEYKNKIAITYATNGSFIAGTTVYMLAKGETETLNWLKGLSENAGRNVFNKHSKVVKTVANGDADVGLVNHYYIYRHLAKHPDAPIKIILPDQNNADVGIAWNVAGVALSKYSTNSKNALKFIEFLVSPEGQKMFAEVNKEYPTRNGIPTAPEIPELNKLKVANVPMEQLGKNRNKTLDLIDKSGLQ